MHLIDNSVDDVLIQSPILQDSEYSPGPALGIRGTYHVPGEICGGKSMGGYGSASGAHRTR
jgi:hypothetical protein